MSIQQASISTEYITLDAFLKYVGIAATGGHAKTLITAGAILVNDQIELRRGRKLRNGDQIHLRGAGRWQIIHKTPGEEG